MGVREGVRGALVERPRGLPWASRSIRPSHGSGVSRVMPATSNAFEFTQAPCTSRFSRKTGRSGTTSSRSSFVGVPPGKCAISQPPPKIQGSSRMPFAYATTASRYASTPGRSWSETWSRYRPANGVDVRVLERRQHHPAGRWRTSFASGNRSRTSGSVPTATMRSPRIATAPAHRRAASIV